MKPPPLILLSTFAAALLALAACRTPARVPLRTVPAVSTATLDDVALSGVVR